MVKNMTKGAMFGIDARIAILVITILGLLVFPTIVNVVSKSRAEAILASTRSVTSAIESYIEDTGSIPNTIDNLFTTAPTKASQSSGWKGPYLKGEQNARFVPTLNWTLVDNDCTNVTTNSRYCTYRVGYNFCKFPESVSNTLQNYYASSDQQITYTAGTECILIDYGYANSGTATYVSFKVKETP